MCDFTTRGMHSDDTVPNPFVALWTSVFDEHHRPCIDHAQRTFDYQSPWLSFFAIPSTSSRRHHFSPCWCISQPSLQRPVLSVPPARTLGHHSHSQKVEASWAFLRGRVEVCGGIWVPMQLVAGLPERSVFDSNWDGGRCEGASGRWRMSENLVDKFDYSNCILSILKGRSSVRKLTLRLSDNHGVDTHRVLTLDHVFPADQGELHGPHIDL